MPHRDARSGAGEHGAPQLLGTKWQFQRVIYLKVWSSTQWNWPQRENPLLCTSQTSPGLLKSGRDNREHTEPGEVVNFRPSSAFVAQQISEQNRKKDSFWWSLDDFIKLLNQHSSIKNVFSTLLRIRHTCRIYNTGIPSTPRIFDSEVWRGLGICIYKEALQVIVYLWPSSAQKTGRCTWLIWRKWEHFKLQFCWSFCI